jgi:hypothetical protein
MKSRFRILKFFDKIFSFNIKFNPTLTSCIIKRITVVIYSFRNKLECLSLNTRLGWKGLSGTNTLAYYGNRKLRP